MAIGRLFVYGTLQPGEANAHLLEQIGGSWQRAFVHGHYDANGWGKTGGYPALKLSDDSAKVSGYIFSSPALAEHWPRLDEFEGQAYERTLTDAHRAGGAPVTAHVYILRD